MPSGGVLAAFAIAGMLYFGGVQAVHGVKKLGHLIKTGVVRVVHPPHDAPAPPSSEEP